MAKKCGVKHPDLTLFCERPGDGLQANHKYHTAHRMPDNIEFTIGDFVDWENTDYEIKEPEKKRTFLKSMADRYRNA